MAVIGHVTSPQPPSQSCMGRGVLHICAYDHERSMSGGNFRSPLTLFSLTPAQATSRSAPAHSIFGPAPLRSK